MFGLGIGEIVIILVLALILLGPEKLPDTARQLGKGLREFRKATDELRSQFEKEVKDVVPDIAKPELAPPAEVGTEQDAGREEPLWQGAVPQASARNVPGLEAALAEPTPSPEPAGADVG
jgi:sec-independent protein translocase protein TatB